MSRLRDLIEDLQSAVWSAFDPGMDEAEDYASRHFRLYPGTIHHHATHVQSGTDKHGHTVSLYHHKPTNTYHVVKSHWEHGKAEKQHKHLYSTGLAKDAHSTFHSLTKRAAAA